MDLAGARPRARVGESTSPDSTQGADASWTTLAARHWSPLTLPRLGLLRLCRRR